jgi:hypothetical protein
MTSPVFIGTARTDPYALWAYLTNFAGMPPTQDHRIPLLIGVTTVADAEKLGKELTGKGVTVPDRPASSRYITAYVPQQSLTSAITSINSFFNARWEMGLPFASPTDWAATIVRPKRPKSVRPIVGFIDYGCAFAHRQFQEPGTAANIWSTRVFALWNQGGDKKGILKEAKASGQPYLPDWASPVDFVYGVEVWRNVSHPVLQPATSPAPSKPTRLTLNDYVQKFFYAGQIKEETCYRLSGYADIQAPVTHGTFVMDLAVGYPDPLLVPGKSAGPPPENDLVFVQLPRFFDGVQVSGLLRTYVLDAVRYIFSCAEIKTPVTINLSYGSNAGPHDGSSLLEEALDEAIKQRRAERGVTNIVIAAGNSRYQYQSAALPAQQIHAQKTIEGGNIGTIGWENIPDNPTDQFVEIWLDGQTRDQCTIRLTPPGADPMQSPWVEISSYWSIGKAPDAIAMIVAPSSVCQSLNGRMVLIAVAPTVPTLMKSTAVPPLAPSVRSPAPYGKWTIEIQNPSNSTVEVNAWCERDEPVFGTASGPRQAKFMAEDSSDTCTLNSIGHGHKTIVVGGYVGGSGRVPNYSSTGPGRNQTTSRFPPTSTDPGKQGPEWLAICEESDALPGLAAATVLGTDRVRLNGTSAAAARATRYVVANHGQDPNLDVSPPAPQSQDSLPKVDNPIDNP